VADIVSDGFTRISWITSVSNPAAPTTAELNAGVALESYITADGLDMTTETQEVDNSALNSTQNTALVGRRGDSVELTFKSQGKAGAPWTTFASNPNGWLVRRSGLAASTAWTAAQKVTVIPCQAGYRQEMPPAANTLEKFSVKFVISGTVQDGATVA